MLFKRKTSIENIKKGSFFVLTFFIFLLVLEGSLRALAIPLLFENPDNRVSPFDSKKFKILTIGESTTTDDYLGPFSKISWPRILEQSLDQKGFDVKVYNEAHAAVNSSFLFSKFTTWLSEYQPNLIIVMMGINDTGRLRAKKDSSNFWDTLKTKKLIIWSYLAIKILLLEEQVDFNQFDNLYDSINESKWNEDEFSKLTGDPYLLTGAFRKLNWLLHARCNRLKTRICFENFEMSLDYQLDHLPLRSDFIYSYMIFKNDLASNDKRSRQQSCLRIVEKSKAESFELDSKAELAFVNCMSEAPEKIVQEHLSLFEFSKIEPGFFHRKMKQIALDSKIPIIFMQYPTLSIDRLRNLVGLADGVYFLGNEENFKRILAQKKFDEVFFDRFGGSFGHSTKIGNTAIADRVRDFVIKTFNLPEKL